MGVWVPGAQSTVPEMSEGQCASLGLAMAIRHSAACVLSGAPLAETAAAWGDEGHFPVGFNAFKRQGG